MESPTKTLQSLPVGVVEASMNLAKICAKQIITANDRVHDPGLCGCLRFNDLLLSPKRLVA